MKTNKNSYKEEYVKIQGIEQYLLHYQGNSDKHVLLYVHGGPGFSESNFGYLVDQQLCNRYPIVYWDQRGAGKTVLKNKKEHLPKSIDQMIQDLLEVVLYLKQEYRIDKVVLIGHSWGSILSTLFVLKYPEHVEAYIGTGQFISTYENELIGYETTIQKASLKDREKLEALGPYPTKDIEVIKNKIKKVRKIQSKYDNQNLVQVVKLMSKSPTFKISDIKPLLQLHKNNEVLIDEMLRFDLTHYSNQYKIPVHYILGENDITTPTSISSKYYETIQAPIKSIKIIKDAGHTPIVEQTEQFIEALLNVLAD